MAGAPVRSHGLGRQGASVSGERQEAAPWGAHFGDEATVHDGGLGTRRAPESLANSSAQSATARPRPPKTPTRTCTASTVTPKLTAYAHDMGAAQLTPGATGRNLRGARLCCLGQDA